MFGRGRWCVIMCLVALLCGCKSNENNGGSTLSLLAQILKGKVSLANVAAYELFDNGVKGRMVGDGQTDDDGNVTLALSGLTSRYVLLTGSGGVIDDPFSGSQITIPPNWPLCAIVDTDGDLSRRYQVNPATTWVTKRTEELARQPDVDLNEAYRNADLNLRNKFELSAPIESIVARDLQESQSQIDDGTEVGFLSAILCEYAASNSRNVFELTWLLGTDLRDGDLDGSYANTPIEWIIGGSLDEDIWSVGLKGAFDNYIVSGLNVNNYTANDTGIDDALVNDDDLDDIPSFLRIWPRYVLITGYDSADMSFITVMPLTSMFTVPNATGGTGSFFYLPIGSHQPIPFAYFSDTLNQVDATGGYEFQDNGGSSFGGVSQDGGAGVSSPGQENHDLDQIAIQFQLLF